MCIRDRNPEALIVFRHDFRIPRGFRSFQRHRKFSGEHRGLDDAVLFFVLNGYVLKYKRNF